MGAASSNLVLKLVAEFAKDQGNPLKIDWASFDKSKLYFLSLHKALSNPLIDAKDFALLSQIGFGPGYCATMNEAGSGLLLLKPLLETEFKEVYARYDSILKSKSPCRWVHIRRAWAGDSKYVAPLKSLLHDSPEARKLASDSFKPNLSEDDYKMLIAKTHAQDLRCQPGQARIQPHQPDGGFRRPW